MSKLTVTTGSRSCLLDVAEIVALIAELESAQRGNPDAGSAIRRLEASIGDEGATGTITLEPGQELAVARALQTIERNDGRLPDGLQSLKDGIEAGREVEHPRLALPRANPAPTTQLG